MMKKIILIGAGGLAKEIYGYIQEDIKHGLIQDLVIKGFLAPSKESFESLNIESNYLGHENDYQIELNDFFVLAIGDVLVREQVLARLEKKNARFFTYIHSSVFIDSSASIGKGVVICPFSAVNAQSVVGDFTLMNIFSSIAHDSEVGSNSILSPYATLNGGVKAGDGLFMATKSMILPNLVVEENCTISAGVVVSKRMKAGTLAYPKCRTVYKEK